MPIAFTAHAKLKDWKALQELHERVLWTRAKMCGARRLCLYRNINDATQVLLLAEFAQADQLHEFLGTWFGTSAALSNSSAHETLWEPLGWAEIP